jgi:hypothetical protein
MLMSGTMVAFFPIALFLARRLPGHSFVFGLFFGLAFGMSAGVVGCLIYAWTVRLHTHQTDGHGSGPRSWGGLV